MKQGGKALSLVFISVYFLFCLLPDAFAQKEKEAISSFEKQVAIFEKFFASDPLLLQKQGYKESPTRFIFFYARFGNCKISYDIKKADSVISPFMGHISVNYMSVDSKNCGDVQGTSGHKFFSTIEAARNSRNEVSCYKVDIEHTVKFIFAYQNYKWVFKDVLNTDTNKTATWLDPVFFGRANENSYYVGDNEFWRVLIQ